MTTKNELQNFEEEFFKKIREKDAWKNISQNDELPWDLKFIEKYSDKLDWEELCKNNAIAWDTELIEKFKYLIDWNALSESIISNRWRHNNYNFDWNIFKKFEKYWNWHELSKNSVYIPTNILEQNADNWDWKELIDNGEINWSYEFFEKFKKYIPITDFENLQRSKLWEKLVKIDEQILTGKLLSE
ncbi:MAG: hypothetical protein K8R58_05845 [Bacteroidales bacterium]|nr:hypothetical protein [Bacteroidales bacterium]